MDLNDSTYTEFKDSEYSKIQNTTTTHQKPSLTNYIGPKDEFYSLNTVFPIVPAKVPIRADSLDKEVLGYPLPITPTVKEGYVNIDDLKADSYVELTNYKMNYPGQGSTVDLTKVLEQLRVANIPVGNPANSGQGIAIHANFAELEEESIVFEPNGTISRFYIASLGIVGLLILYRMMKL
jgi:hypothetical protein